MDDLISRQAALETIHKAMYEFFDLYDDDDKYIPLTEEERTLFAINKKLTKKIKALPSELPKIIKCQDCKYFEYDHLYIVRDIPVLAHEVCNAWGDGCKTDENGYCFMAERKDDEQIR